jgi:hypothetical protein
LLALKNVLTRDSRLTLSGPLKHCSRHLIGSSYLRRSFFAMPLL